MHACMHTSRRIWSEKNSSSYVHTGTSIFNSSSPALLYKFQCCGTWYLVSALSGRQQVRQFLKNFWGHVDSDDFLRLNCPNLRHPKSYRFMYNIVNVPVFDLKWANMILKTVFCLFRFSLLPISSKMQMPLTPPFLPQLNLNKRTRKSLTVEEYQMILDSALRNLK